MDFLQRLQRWYTINCDGDWEYSYGISITNVSNPGWWVTIDLQDTCLENAVLPHQPIQKRSPTNWAHWYIEDYKFIASGGPENLFEILTYFLDTLLPQQSNKELEYEVYIPLPEYNGLIWRLAYAYIISESQLCITRLSDLGNPSSYAVTNDDAFEPFKQLEARLFITSDAVVKAGDIIEATIQELRFTTSLVYIRHSAS